jgi:hypothetical protein
MSNIGLSLDMSDSDNVLLMMALYELLEDGVNVQHGLSNIVTPENYEYLLETIGMFKPYMDEIREERNLYVNEKEAS